jgi:outer membrane protein TolC
MSSKYLRYTLFLLLAEWSLSGKAQCALSANEAVQLALKNNYDILIALTATNIAQANNTPGNAGMLPAVSLNGSGTYAAGEVRQKQADGSSKTYSDAVSKTTQAGVELNWTLFDGGKMFLAKNRLKQAEALGEIRFRQTVLESVSNVLAAYYDKVRQQQQLEAIQKVIAVNEDRVKILQTGFNTGVTAKNNLLQAQIDLNVNRENAIQQQLAIVESHRELCRLLAVNPDSCFFSLTDSILTAYVPDSSALAQKIFANNPELLALQHEEEMARLLSRESSREWMPQLGLNAGYGFQKSYNSTSSTKETQSLRPQLGWNISVPLYQGGNITRQNKITRMQHQTATYNLQNARLTVSVQLRNALTDFRNQQALLSIEKENASLARENMEIALQRLRFGQSTSLEVRQAQDSYQASLTRLTNFSYNLKMAEIKLKVLAGEDI